MRSAALGQLRTAESTAGAVLFTLMPNSLIGSGSIGPTLTSLPFTYLSHFPFTKSGLAVDPIQILK